MIRRISASLLVVTGVLIALGSHAVAQPLADRIPADAILYVGCAGTDSPGPGYEGSHLKAVVDASGAERVITEVIPKLLEKIAEKEPRSAEQMRALLDIAMPMLRHPTAIYMGMPDFGARNEPPKVRFAYVCDAGADAPAMKGRLDEGVKKIAGNLPFPMSVRTTGGIVALAVGEMPDFDEILSGKAKDKALTGSKNFVAAMSMQKAPVLAAYVNAEAWVKIVDDAVTKGNDAEAKKRWPAVRDALGLRGLKRLAFTQGFDGKDWATHVFIEAPAPRAGLLAGLDAKPVSDAAISVIPSTATMSGVARLDLAGLFDGLRDAIEKIDADASRDVERGIRDVNQMLGVDLRQDVLAPLGDEWAYYVAPELTGRGPLGLVVVNRLKDEKKAQEVLEKLKEFANTVIAGQAEAGISIRFKQGTVGGVPVHYLATPFVSPSWAVQNGNLYIGLYPQIVAAAAAHVSKEGKSILANPDFVALRKRLGGERAVSFQFYDLPRSAPTGYQIWLLFTSFAKAADVIGVDTPAALLLPLGTLLQHLSPAGGISLVDERGWHYRAVSPFPGSVVLASDTAGALDVQSSALAISVMLPALNRAREQANRVKSASNLRQIGQACFIYANENNGKFPDELAATLGEDLLTPHVFVNPRTKNSLPAGLEGDAAKRWVNEQSDYAYRGKGKTAGAGAESILAHEKPQGLGEGINVLFADGHVEFLPLSRAQELIQKDRAVADDGGL